MRLPVSLMACGKYEEFAKGPGARHGRSNSLKWPWLYDKLVAKGYDHSKAAAISNSRIGTRKTGRISVLPAKLAHSPAVLKRLREADKKGKHSTRGSLTRKSFGTHTEEFYNKDHSKSDGKFTSGESHEYVGPMHGPFLTGRSLFTQAEREGGGSYDAGGKRVTPKGGFVGLRPSKTASKEAAYQEGLATIRAKTGYKGDPMDHAATALKYRRMRTRTPAQTKRMKGAETFGKLHSALVRETQ